MLTCAFCGSEIKNKFCAFCEMELQDRHIMRDGKRLNQAEKFLGYPSSSQIHQSTSDLMGMETITLLCLLREARSFRAEVYKLRLLRHKAEEETGFNEDVEEIEEYTFTEYEQATRKVWVIENIIKDRLGYFPERVTMNFLNQYIERMKRSERNHKTMKIVQSINKKTKKEV